MTCRSAAPRTGTASPFPSVYTCVHVPDVVGAERDVLPADVDDEAVEAGVPAGADAVDHLGVGGRAAFAVEPQVMPQYGAAWAEPGRTRAASAVVRVRMGVGPGFGSWRASLVAPRRESADTPAIP